MRIKNKIIENKDYQLKINFNNETVRNNGRVISFNISEEQRRKEITRLILETTKSF